MLTHGAPGVDAAFLQFSQQVFGHLLRFQPVPFPAQEKEVHRRLAGVEQSPYPIDSQVVTPVVAGAAQVGR